MARYRIKQKPSACTAGQRIFEAEERCFFWWEPRGIFLSLEAAEQRIQELQTIKPLETKILKEYD